MLDYHTEIRNNKTPCIYFANQRIWVVSSYFKLFPLHVEAGNETDGHAVKLCKSLMDKIFFFLTSGADWQHDDQCWDLQAYLQQGHAPWIHHLPCLTTAHSNNVAVSVLEHIRNQMKTGVKDVDWPQWFSSDVFQYLYWYTRHIHCGIQWHTTEDKQQVCNQTIFNILNIYPFHSED